MLKVDDDLEAVVLQAIDGLPRHAQIFFGRGLKGFLDIEQPRFDHHHGNGNAPLVAHDELHVGPLLDLGAAAAGAAKKGQLHGACVGRCKAGGQVGDKLVGAGETDLRKVHAERAHALQKQDGVGYGDFEIRLLQSVAQAGIEQLDSSGFGRFHGVSVTDFLAPLQEELRRFFDPL